MKKNLLRTISVIVVLLCSALLFFSCSQDDNIVIPQDELAISDPQIKKEIEFMKTKGIIDEDLYQQWLKAKRSDVLDEWDVHIDEAGTVRHDGAYRITPPSDIQSSPGSMTMIDDRQIDRRLIQDLMKE